MKVMENMSMYETAIEEFFEAIRDYPGLLDVFDNEFRASIDRDLAACKGGAISQTEPLNFVLEWGCPLCTISQKDRGAFFYRWSQAAIHCSKVASNRWKYHRKRAKDQIQGFVYELEIVGALLRTMLTSSIEPWPVICGSEFDVSFVIQTDQWIGEAIQLGPSPRDRYGTSNQTRSLDKGFYARRVKNALKEKTKEFCKTFGAEPAQHKFIIFIGGRTFSNPFISSLRGEVKEYMQELGARCPNFVIWSYGYRDARGAVLEKTENGTVTARERQAIQEAFCSRHVPL